MPNSAVAERSNQDYWMLEMNAIHPHHRANEAAIRTKRWFDYRAMTGAEATYLFAETYRLQYIESYKETKDIGSADQITPFTPDDIFQSNDLTAMWLARQAADEIGCTYPFYLRHVFNVFTTRGWKNLPRPNQIYSEELSISVNTAWQQRCSDILQIAVDPFFQADHYVGHPDQLDYYECLIKQVKRRPNSYMALAGLLERKIIPHEIAMEAFGAETFKRALMF